MDETATNLQRRVGERQGKRLGRRSRQHRAVERERPQHSKKVQQSLETRDRILDAAELLFARHSLYGVTVRNVAQKAGVDTALIHYYFGTKRGMFDAVFARRSEGINDARFAAMAEYEASCDGKVSVEGALRAFLSPILANDRQPDPGWKNFSALVALANNSQEWGGEMMSRYFDKVILRLIELLKKALPMARDEDLFWAYQMFSGSLMVLQAQTGRIELLSGGLCRSDDVDAFAERLVAFGAAGFHAVAERRR